MPWKKNRKADEKLLIYQTILTLSCTSEEKAIALTHLVKIYARRTACAKPLYEACMSLVANDQKDAAGRAIGNYHLGLIYEMGNCGFTRSNKSTRLL